MAKGDIFVEKMMDATLHL